MQPVDLRRHDEIALGQAVDLVRPQRDLNFAPSQQDVGVMPLLFGNPADAIYEFQGLFEIRKSKLAVKIVFIGNRPVRNLLLQGIQFLAFQRRYAPFAGHTFLVSELFGHDTPHKRRLNEVGLS